MDSRLFVPALKAQPVRSDKWSSASISRKVIGSLGDRFHLETLTIGVFLNSMPSHAAHSNDGPARYIPLPAGHGWIQPSAAEGYCEWEGENDLLTISLDRRTLMDVGMTDPGGQKPYFGEIDPLIIQLISALYSAGGNNSTLYKESLTLALAAHLAHQVAPARDISVPDDRRIARAVDFVFENLSSDLSLDDMAAVASLSPFHFSKAFKLQTGLSPHQFVIKQRIAKAKLLLKTTKLSVFEIAFRVGMNDQPRFNRLFKQRVGVSPSAFRAN